MDQKLLGLFRLVGYPWRDEIEKDLSVSFQDTYDALEGARFEIRELEKMLDRIFYGSDYGKAVE